MRTPHPDVQKAMQRSWHPAEPWYRVRVAAGADGPPRSGQALGHFQRGAAVLEYVVLFDNEPMPQHVPPRLVTTGD